MEVPPERGGRLGSGNSSHERGIRLTDLVATMSEERERGAPAAVESLPRRLTKLPMRALRRLEWFWDESEVSRTPGARRIRLVFGALLCPLSVLFLVVQLSNGAWGIGPIVMFLAGIAIVSNRGGRFAYYFLPVCIGLFSYLLVGRYAVDLKLSVHYAPQIDADRLLPGPLPTVWLQEHLYHGRTGVLEVFAVVMYFSHFVVPLLLGFGLAMVRRGREFASLMFTMLVALILAEFTFVLFPTAPPWLAAEHGMLPGVNHMLKATLYDLDLTSVGDLIGDSSKYDVTAAVPSLHAAFPIIALLVVRRYGLPGWLSGLLALNFLGVVFAIVYTGDHYLVDAVAGVLYALVAWRLVERFLGKETAASFPEPSGKAASAVAGA